MSDILLSEDITPEYLKSLKYKDQKSICASLPLNDKIEFAIDLIKKHEPKDGYYVAFSGGKDSIVILDLVQRAGVKYDVHYAQTTVDPPEIQQFIKQYYPYVNWNKPKSSMYSLIPKKKLLPTRMFRWCCAELKEIGGKNRVVVLGIRWCESRGRRFRIYYDESAVQKDKFYINPILSFTEEDIWSYIRDNHLPYPSLYYEGYKRVGCIMCPLTNKSNKLADIKRYPKHCRAYLRAIAKMLQIRKDLGKDWKHGENDIGALYWWIYERDGASEEIEQFKLYLTECGVINE